MLIFSETTRKRKSHVQVLTRAILKTYIPDFTPDNEPKASL
jgi:hypothetical protein